MNERLLSSKLWSKANCHFQVVSRQSACSLHQPGTSVLNGVGSCRLMCMYRIMSGVSRIINCVLVASLPFSGFSDLKASEPIRAGTVTHRCGDNTAGWQPQRSQYGEMLWFNLVKINQQTVEWNGSTVERNTLKRYLKRAARNRFGGLVLVLDSSLPCDRIERLRRALTEQFKCSPNRICVEYSTEEWLEEERAMTPPPAPDQ